MGGRKVTISLHNSLAEIEENWRSLQETGLCTLYQTFEWCKAWQDTAGNARRIEPSIIFGCTQQGKPLFILPFAIENSMGIRLLRWFGAAELTYGMGIYDRQHLKNNPDFVETLWSEILDLLGDMDSISLDNQPEQWNGIVNPLKFLFTTRGANQSYKMALEADYQALYEKKRSSSSRRGARKRDKKLAAAGELVFGLPKAGSATYDVINTMINHQQDRLGDRGIRSVYDETRRAFLQQLARAKWQDGSPVLLPYFVSVDGEICAVMLGGAFQSTYWALISSLTPDTRLHRLSPGDRALRESIKASCERGFVAFDFAAGDTEYKTHWSDETVKLFETIKIVTMKGAVFTVTATAGTNAKRLVKQTPWLFSLAQSARELLFRKNS